MMATVVHVFPEKHYDDQCGHLEFWYGLVRPEDEDGEAVCWCGAHSVHLNNDVKAVWHLRTWSDVG